METRRGRQQVGDFTVTPFPGGHLIGQLRVKAVAEGDHGFGWDYLGNDSDTQAAIRKARLLAEQANTAAWMFEDDGSYQQIPTRPPSH
jgi:hypothetical protein